MDLSKLGKDVVGLWDFVRPRIATSAIMILVALYASPRMISKLVRSVPYERFYLTEDLQKSLHFYGLDKIVPLVAFFVALVIVHVVYELSVLASDILPGRLLISPHHQLSVVLARDAGSDSEHASTLGRRMVARFPEAQDNLELWTAMTEFVGSMSKETSDLRRNLVFREENLKRHSDVCYSAKLFFYLTVLLGVVEILGFRSPIRIVAVPVAVVTSICIIVIVIYGYLTIEDWMKVVSATVDAAMAQSESKGVNVSSRIEIIQHKPFPFWRFVWIGDTFNLNRIKFYLGLHSHRIPCFFVHPTQDSLDREERPFPKLPIQPS